MRFNPSRLIRTEPKVRSRPAARATTSGPSSKPPAPVVRDRCRGDFVRLSRVQRKTSARGESDVKNGEPARRVVRRAGVSPPQTRFSKKCRLSNRLWLSPPPTPADKADDITGPIKYDVTENTVHITWQEPAAPNGMIILYEVNYKRHGDTEVTRPPPFGFASVHRGDVAGGQGGVGSLWVGATEPPEICLRRRICHHLSRQISKA